MFFSHKVNNLLFVNLALVLMFSSPFSSKADTHESIKICTGKAFGNKWDSAMAAFITEAFVDTGLTVEILASSAKRAEQNFKNKKCGGYFLAHRGFASYLDRTDIFYIPHAIFSASVKFYVPAGSQCTEAQQCLASFTNKEQIGSYSSLTLSQYISEQTQASIVELPAIRQGVEMLRKGRIDAFIFPIVKKEHIPFGMGKLKELNNLTSTPLYFWLDDKYKPYEHHLTKTIESLLLKRDLAPYLTNKKGHFEK